jgi:serine phosphatase RsbU (regulator of sigma subunit)
MEPGDRILMFTDSVTECKSGERDFFSEERLDNMPILIRGIHQQD